MNKYSLKMQYHGSQIITKSESGQEVLIGVNDFNDYWAERMIQMGQSHMITINPTYVEAFESQKKSFIPISEGVILSTLKQELIEGKEPLTTAKPQELKRKRGRQPKAKI